MNNRFYGKVVKKKDAHGKMKCHLETKEKRNVEFFVLRNVNSTATDDSLFEPYLDKEVEVHGILHGNFIFAERVRKY